MKVVRLINGQRLRLLSGGVMVIGLMAALPLLWHSAASPVGTSPATPMRVPLRAGLAADDRVTAYVDGKNLVKCLRMYGELTGRELWPGTRSVAQRLDDRLDGRLSRWGLVRQPPKFDTGIQYHRDGRFTVQEIKEQLETVAGSAGFQITPNGAGFFSLRPSSAAAPHH